MNFVDEAISELNVALMQSGPEDDQIIMGRVRNALEYLEQERREAAIRVPSSPERIAYIAEVMDGHTSLPPGASIPGTVSPSGYWPLRSGK